MSGHLLGVTAAWLVQIGIEVYHCFFAKSEEDGEMLDRSKSAKIFMKKFSGMTVRCCASLAFASIGAGVGSLCYPSIGQWIGKQTHDVPMNFEIFSLLLICYTIK